MLDHMRKAQLIEQTRNVGAEGDVAHWIIGKELFEWQIAIALSVDLHVGQGETIVFEEADNFHACENELDFVYKFEMIMK